MKILLIPTRYDLPLALERRGDVLVVNGEEFDFSPLEEGATLPVGSIHSDWFNNGPVSREGGELSIVLIMPHGANAPEESRIAHEITVDQDGPISIPVYDVLPDPITQEEASDEQH